MTSLAAFVQIWKIELIVRSSVVGRQTSCLVSSRCCVLMTFITLTSLLKLLLGCRKSPFCASASNEVWWFAYCLMLSATGAGAGGGGGAAAAAAAVIVVTVMSFIVGLCCIIVGTGRSSKMGEPKTIFF